MKVLITLFTVLILVGCGSKIPEDRPQTGKIVFLGASITEGYEVKEEASYVGIITQKLNQEGFKYEVLNQGISGDKTSDGLSRIEAVIKAKPEIVVVALGGNDFLRRKKINTVRSNLSEIIETIQVTKADVLLVGVTAPPTGGLGYTRDAKKMYQSLSDEYEVPLMPNYLKGLALDQRYMKSDRIHPNEAGHQKLADNMWEYLEPLLRRP